MALPAKTATVDGKRVGGASPTLTLQVQPLEYAVDETVTATVRISNDATSAAVVTAPGGSYYNVKVTTPEGDTAFDSWELPEGASLPLATRVLQPGASMADVVRFSLEEPGEYRVQAYLNGPFTPAVTITVRSRPESGS